MRFLEDIIVKFGSVDRRVIFILIGLAVLVPLLNPVDLAIRPTPSSQRVYDAVDSIPDNSKVLISFDYGPSTKPEIHPMTLGVMRHILNQDRGHTIYITCLWPDGLYMAKDVLKILNEEYDLGEGNVFITRPKTLPGVKYIPLIDYTNGHGRYWYPDKHGSDYFGFRNKYDYNVKNKKDKFDSKS